MNKNRILTGIALGLATSTLALAQASVPADLQPLLDGADATFDAVKVIVIAVVLFGIGLYFAKKVKKS